MIDPNKKEREPAKPSEVCYRAFELMKAKQYAETEKLLANNLARTEDETAIALYHSTLGVLFKLQGDYRTAWKHYERAEKLLPKDPALKIISARLLIDQFHEYDQAIKKAKKVLSLIPDNPVFAHQAHVTMGLAYVKKGQKQKAVHALEQAMEHGFRGFLTAANIDLHLVESLLRRKWGVEVCGGFLQKALAFAEGTEEEMYMQLYRKMVDGFQQEYTL